MRRENTFPFLSSFKIKKTTNNEYIYVFKENLEYICQHVINIKSHIYNIVVYNYLLIGDTPGAIAKLEGENGNAGFKLLEGVDGVVGVCAKLNPYSLMYLGN